MFKETHAFSSYSVNDLEKAKAFYADTLGLDVKELPGMGIELHLAGGNTVFLYDSKENPPAKFTVLNFTVDSIDTAIAELEKKGIKMERYDNLPAKQDEKGVLRGLAAGQGPDIAWFKDPSGNTLSVIQSE